MTELVPRGVVGAFDAITEAHRCFSSECTRATREVDFAGSFAGEARDVG